MFKVFAVLGLALTALSIYTTGLAQNVSAENAQMYGLQILEVGTTSSLLVAFLGVSLFTKEFGRGLIIRSVINAGSIRKVLHIKLLVSLIIGAIFSVTSTLVSIVGLQIWMHQNHVSFNWNGTSIIFIVRTFLIIMLSATWGTSLGWVGKGEKTTTWGFLFYRLLITPILIVLVPKCESWLPGYSLTIRTIEQGSSLSKLVSGTLIFAAWICFDVFVGDLIQRRKGYL